MKKITSFIIVLLLAKLSMAQGIAINNNNVAPNSSAMLDVQSTTKGMLTPRMTTAQRTAIVSPAKGLIVFDTDVNSFWFYDGLAWNNLSPSSTNWSLSGNSGISASNFIGTTDGAALNLKTNNKTRLFIGGNGYIGINNTAPTAMLDVKGTTGAINANFNLTSKASSMINGIVSTATNSGTGGAYGGNFTAIGSGGSGTAAGVSTYAQGGYNNYGFFSGVLTSSGQSGYGIYASSSGGGNNWGGYLKGDKYGIQAESDYCAGYFKSPYKAIVAEGQYGAIINSTHKGLEVNLNTTINDGGWTEYGIDAEVNNNANTDHIYGVKSYVDGKGATGNVIGVYSEPHGAASGFLTSFYGVGNVNITGSYYSSSDAKLKQNIKPVQSMMDKIMQLKPSTYQYRTDEYAKMNLPKGNQFGMIAQDVQKVFPELVADQVKPASFDNKTKEKLSDEVEYLGVNYNGFIPIIISGMQDLQKENTDLKKENEALRNDIAEIKATLAKRSK